MQASRWTPVIGLVIVVGLVWLLLTLVAPPNPQSALVWVGDIAYKNEQVAISAPPACQNQSDVNGNSTTYAFQSVQFTLGVTSWCSPDGGALNGSAVEPNDTIFHFVIPAILAGTYATWISSDKFCGVEWNRAGIAILLVVDVADTT